MVQFEGTADIQYHDGPLLLPQSLSLNKAIKMLCRLRDQQEETTEFSRTFDCLPQDGLFALNAVLVQTYGWSTGVPTPGFFGDSPPEMKTIEIDYDKKTEVPMGRLALPNLDGGFLDTNFPVEGGRRRLGLSC